MTIIGRAKNLGSGRDGIALVENSREAGWH